MKETAIRFWTGILILFGLIGVVIWDLFAFIFGGNKATISVVITDFSRKYPYIPFIVAFIFGMLTGHFFIPAQGSGL